MIEKIDKIGKFFFWFQYVVFFIGLLLIFVFGEFLSRNNLDEIVIILTYFFGLPAVLSIVCLIFAKEDKKDQRN